MLETHENCPDDCCLSSKHWDLIRWFFERIPYIEVTEIIENNVRNLEFADTVLHELWQSKSIFLKICGIQLNRCFHFRIHHIFKFILGKLYNIPTGSNWLWCWYSSIAYIQRNGINCQEKSASRRKSSRGPHICKLAAASAGLRAEKPFPKIGRKFCYDCK